MFAEEELLATKKPAVYCPDGKNQYFTWFRMYDNHPPGFRPNLLPVEVFDLIREQEELDATDAEGNPPYAIGFDTEEEAWEAAITAVLTIAERNDQRRSGDTSSASAT
jgi:hypothetical protein